MANGWMYAAVLLALAVFGMGYNLFVERLERRGFNRGYTALLVVGGTLITLGGAAILIGWQAALIVLICFAASGSPMTIGSLARYARERWADEEKARALAREILDDKKAGGRLRVPGGFDPGA